MGHYTEIRVNLTLRKDVPEDVIAVLRGMVERPSEPGEEFKQVAASQTHAFFKARNWWWMLWSGSAYFPEKPWRELVETPDGWRLRAVANLKNGDGEIGKFAEWIRPFVVDQPEPFVTSEYEEARFYDDEPLWCYFTNGREAKGARPTSKEPDRG